MSLIPLEIQELIISHCDNTTLSQCALVDSSWARVSRHALLSTKTVELHPMCVNRFIDLIQHDCGTLRSAMSALHTLSLSLWSRMLYRGPGCGEWTLAEKVAPEFIEGQVLSSLVDCKAAPTVLNIRTPDDFIQEWLTPYPSLSKLLVGVKHLTLDANRFVDSGALDSFVAQCTHLNALSVAAMVPLGHAFDEHAELLFPSSLRRCWLDAGCLRLLTRIGHCTLEYLSVKPTMDDAQVLGKCLQPTSGLLAKHLAIHFRCDPAQTDWNFTHQTELSSLSLIVHTGNIDGVLSLVRPTVFRRDVLKQVTLILAGTFNPTRLQSSIDDLVARLSSDMGTSIPSIAVVGGPGDLQGVHNARA